MIKSTLKIDTYVLARVQQYVIWFIITRTRAHMHTRLTAFCPGLPGWASTRKIKPTWILLKQETVSGISWAICKCAPCSRQITMAAPHHSFFTGHMSFLLPNQQWQSTHTHPFSGTTRVGRYQKSKTNLDFIEARDRQITTPASHRSVFYRPDALPATQPTVSKHWREINNHNKL